MTRKILEDRIRRMAWPEPAPDLRARILSEAALVERSIPWSDRVWFSRGWRLAAAAAVTLVAAGSLAESPRPEGDAQTPLSVREIRTIEDVATFAGLPADAAASLARRAVANAPIRRLPLTALNILNEEGDRR